MPKDSLPLTDRHSTFDDFNLLREEVKEPSDEMEGRDPETPLILTFNDAIHASNRQLQADFNQLYLLT